MNLHKTSIKRVLGVSFFIIAVLIGGGFIVKKYFFSHEAITDREKADLPSAVALTKTKTVSSQVTKTTIPDEINFDVPFTSQAPNANWDRTHEEACEEAAILMAERYFNKQPITSADDAEAGLQEIIAWENQNLGFFESTTTNETVRIIHKMFNLKAEIITNPSVDEIKAALADGKLVLVPAAGREIGNPFYTAPGPLYHMLLLKGYTKTQFITNDAGTKRGENYPYNFKTILDANHDWNGGDVARGAKKVIFVWK